ncbi:MAG: ligase-associated DNA damage response endonuclease PdeM [Candidatus Cyclonatronum sp.]|uniref:ligase-associated DNA damage response endonuclease PdeM n=1 Tax=Cyclonatronum sp. TaxID=3024185 RepID=UPI0025C0EAB8|nr:ligase-associated DNA damage response endonuclease PdeM [Cyclonatronum sp.]MCH8487177.1 ligase-associated DNA damage response endonuclease PdeM [Cyclonatronum sp.]
MLHLNFHTISFQLLPEKAVFRPDNRTLYLADTHFGKAGTFRRGGIPLPGGHNRADYARLNGLIGAHQPQRIVFLGDLFHSFLNEEWQEFTEWRSGHPQIGMLLIEGNHDVLLPDDYRQAGLHLQPEGFEDDGLLLNHHPLPEDAAPADLRPSLCGHVHPGVRLSGPGRQHERLPCFRHSTRHKQLMLPAFGSFTGLGIISPKPDDEIYVIAGDAVVRV